MDLWLVSCVLGCDYYMATITAKGLLGNQQETVICKEQDNKIIISFNGTNDNVLKSMLDELLDIAPPMGGTYYPEKGTMQAYYHVLNTVFFKKLTIIEVEGEIEPIPFEDDIIY